MVGIIGRKPKKIDWKDVLDVDIIYTTEGATKKMGMNVPAARRHLNRAVATGQLRKKRHKKRVFYMLPDTYKHICKRRLSKR